MAELYVVDYRSGENNSGDSKSGKVCVVDMNTNTRNCDITLKGSPRKIAFTPDGSFAYVANLKQDSISVIDTANRSVKWIDVGGPTYSLAMSPDGSCCYVGGKYWLKVIDTANSNHSVTATIDLEAYATRVVVITPDSSKVYVSNWNNYVTAINTETKKTKKIPIGQEICDLAVHPKAPRLYIANQAGGDIEVLDTDNDQYLETIYTEDPALFCIAITPDGKYAYTGGAEYISKVDIEQKETMDKIDRYGNKNIRDCNDIEITPDGTRAYASSYVPPDNRQLYVINTENLAVEAKIDGISGYLAMAPQIQDPPIEPRLRPPILHLRE